MSKASEMSPRGVRSENISFEALSYSVHVHKHTIPILEDISGEFVCGKLTALMGPSGSGKSTLMDILADRKNSGVLRGKLQLAGRMHTGYVEQFDTLVGELTVNEMLMYTAELLLPSDTPQTERLDSVNQVIAQLQLEKCRHTVIGNVLNRGISGGQAKRVNIGLALIPKPKVLLLDEPSTGLDSGLANEVMIIVRDLARAGRVVVATVHSPTALIYSLFDDLYLLQGGKTIYNGPREGCKPYMEGLGYTFPADGRYSVVEWLVEITAGSSSTALQEARAMQSSEVATVNAGGGGGGGGGDDAEAPQPSSATEINSGFDFVAAWSECSENPYRHLNGGASQQGDKEVSTVAFHEPPVRAGFFRAVYILLKYRAVKNYSSMEYVAPRLGDKILFALLILSLYWGIGDDEDVQSQQSTASLLYFVVALCGYGAAAVVPSLTLERPLFIRERNDGCYTAGAYWTYKLTEEAVLTMLTSFLFAVVVFWSCKLQGSFWVFVVDYYLCAMTGTVLAYAIASAVPTMEAANALLPTYVTTCMYFGGLFIIYDKIPDGWQWYSYTTFLRYGWTALMVNQFRDFDADPSEDFGGKTILEFYAMNGANRWDNVGYLSVCLLVFAFLGLLAIKFIDHSRR